MKVIPPITLTDAMLTTTAAEPGPGETAWVSAGTYVAGDERIRTETHRKYECITGHTGSSVFPEDDATHWLDIGPTNAWAMFDLERSSQTVLSAADIEVEITPGQRVSSIGLVGLQGDSLTIEMHQGATLLFSRTVSLQLRNTTTWSQYLYGAFRTRKAYVCFDLPLASGATVTITITPSSGAAKCGGVVLGMAEDIGVIVDQPVSEVSNFSKVTRDDFGTATLVKRRNVPVLSHHVRADAARLDRLRELRDDLDATPALWSGADDRQTSNFFDTLLVLGFAKKWSIAMAGPLAVVSDLQLEEI